MPACFVFGRGGIGGVGTALRLISGLDIYVGDIKLVSSR